MTNKITGLSLAIFLAFLALSCTKTALNPNITAFGPEGNAKIKQFLQRNASYEGRKVAVFDGDGTVLGQTPHYLADECLYLHALDNPQRQAKVINEMTGLSNVSLPYVQLRVRYLSGMSLSAVRQMGADCYQKYYAGKIYAPMQQLIQLLQDNAFEVWIVTASPESLYQQFLSLELNIPITRIIGVKSIVRNGIVSADIVHPVPQDEGKKEAIETFIQSRPLLVGGNSRGDKEMIEFSQDLKIIVNPDDHIAEDQSESIADYARQHGWLIIQISDNPAADFPNVSAKQFGIRPNKTKP